MKFKISTLLLLALILFACGPKVKSSLTGTTFPPLDSEEKIFFLEEDEKAPQNSLLVGDLKIGDSGFSTDCGYDVIVEKARIEAYRSGSNIIEIIEIKEPNMASTCYRLKARLYRNLDPKITEVFLSKRELRNKSRLPEDADYAVIHFFRPNRYIGTAIGYKIRHNDKAEIGKIKNNTKFEIKTRDFGKQRFWAKTESEDSVEIDVQRGQEYFVKCEIGLGAFIGQPKLTVVENRLGIWESEKID